MPSEYLYLIVDIGSVLVPFLFSFHPRLKFHRHFSAFFKANILVTTFFLVWDALFTQWGVWGFSEHYTIGWKVAGLPLEEILFFLCIPFCSIFTYHCLDQLLGERFTFPTRTFSLVLAALVLLISIFYLQHVYTSVTFFLTSAFLFWVVYQKQQWLKGFFRMYLLILIPFFIVNGILTGMFTPEPVVWYNDAMNLGLRMGTIPVEDVFYGMLLMLMNVFLFEKFKKNAA